MREYLGVFFRGGMHRVSALSRRPRRSGSGFLTLDTCSDDAAFALASLPSLARTRRAASAAKVVLAEAAS